MVASYGKASQKLFVRLILGEQPQRRRAVYTIML